MLYEQHNADEMVHILCLVRLNTQPDGSMGLHRVELLTVTPCAKNVIVQSIMYVVMPSSINIVFPNVVYAKGGVAVFTEHGLKQMVSMHTFVCEQCNSATRWYNKQTDECECLSGSVPVCLPCNTNCDFNAFVINPDNQMCIIASSPSLTNMVSTGKMPVTLPRYNMHCMPCTGSFYCTDGTVDGVRMCPAN